MVAMVGEQCFCFLVAATDIILTCLCFVSETRNRKQGRLSLPSLFLKEFPVSESNDPLSSTRRLLAGQSLSVA
jgi:hypothetical protein